MASILILKTPPGFAPIQIRKEWVGVEIPLVTPEELAEDPPSELRTGSENGDGFLVLREKAIQALENHEKGHAAAFWRNLPLGRFLIFKKDLCKLLD